MKRTVAAVALLTALGVLCKLALKETPRTRPVGEAQQVGAGVTEPAPEEELRARYPAPNARALVERTLRRYHQTALAIERTDGLRGLALLDRLDLEAVFLYERHPQDFRRLRDSLTDDAAADLLLHWRSYFGLKRSDDTDRGILIAEIARLSPRQRRVAARYPSVLPLVLSDPVGVTELVERWSGDPGDLRDALTLLTLISLEPGAADLRTALRTLEHHGPLALEAFRLRGMEGFALVSLYGPVLDALGDALPLDQGLVVLRVNTDYVDELLGTNAPEVVARHLQHVAAAGLVEPVGGSPNGLRLAVEFGVRGERALTQAGPDAADVVFGDFSDPVLRNQAVEALAEHGTMALEMLDKYATDPDFREILRRYGAPVIPPIAQADPGPELLATLRAKPKRSFSESMAKNILFVTGENGQATIRMIKHDGLERVAALDQTDVKFYQFLPMYDLLHLGRVLTRGQSPTAGEMTWALVDGGFVILDILSLTAAQPEGAAASEAARAEVKTAVREASKAVGTQLIEDSTAVAGRALAREGAEAAGERLLSRWWAIRAAGGTYRVLRRLPEALARMSLPDLARAGRPLCTKAGLRLSVWKPALRFFRNGREVLRPIPLHRGLKYVAAQAVQAGVGVIAFQKMEEHLASRRAHE